MQNKKLTGLTLIGTSKIGSNRRLDLELSPELELDLDLGLTFKFHTSAKKNW